MTASSSKPDVSDSFPLGPTGSRAKAYDLSGGNFLRTVCTLSDPDYHSDITPAHEYCPLSSNDPAQTYALRQSLRQQRRHLSRLVQHRHSNIICERFIHSRLFTHLHDIALYLSADGEVDLSPLINKLHSGTKRCYLPVILCKHSAGMAFAPYDKNTPLRTNHFGILEPVYQKKHLRNARQLDVILTPLVGFDNQGNRMGMGGGFYDRALAHLVNNKTGRKSVRPRVIGIAHELQRLEAIQQRPWDIPLQAVITERQFQYFNGQR
jgi:5-formyltetrahydrofolate cyclo-ligase